MNDAFGIKKLKTWTSFVWIKVKGIFHGLFWVIDSIVLLIFCSSRDSNLPHRWCVSLKQTIHTKILDLSRYLLGTTYPSFFSWSHVGCLSKILPNLAQRSSTNWMWNIRYHHVKEIFAKKNHRRSKSLLSSISLITMNLHYTGPEFRGEKYSIWQ